MLKDTVFDLFCKSGKINYYILYKRLDEEQREDE